MSGMQDSKASLDEDFLKRHKLQPEHIVLEFQVDPGEEDLKPHRQDTKPAVKLSRLLRPYFTVRSCYSAFLQV